MNGFVYLQLVSAGLSRRRPRVWEPPCPTPGRHQHGWPQFHDRWYRTPMRGVGVQVGAPPHGTNISRGRGPRFTPQTAFLVAGGPFYPISMTRQRLCNVSSHQQVWTPVFPAPPSDTGQKGTHPGLLTDLLTNRRRGQEIERHPPICHFEIY